jgi:alpha-L-fucosidase
LGTPRWALPPSPRRPALGPLLPVALVAPELDNLADVLEGQVQRRLVKLQMSRGGLLRWHHRRPRNVRRGPTPLWQPSRATRADAGRARLANPLSGAGKSDRTAIEVCQRLNSAGVTAVLLKYRVLANALDWDTHEWDVHAMNTFPKTIAVKVLRACLFMMGNAVRSRAVPLIIKATLRLALLVSFVNVAVAENSVQPPASAMSQRVEQLKNLRWGMFVCWSFSTFSGQEWTPGVTNVDFFRAKGCDTDQWARTAKEAGMGYVLFLTKHHDGFCLWDTKTTERKVTKAPLGRDVLADLRKSCDKYGIKLALYFSEGEFEDNKLYHPGGYTPEMKKAQLKELLTQYGPIEYIWFDHAQKDGGLNHAETFAFCKSLQPDCFIGFNHGDQSDADIRLGEMGRPGPLEDQSAAGPHMKSPAGKNYRLAEFTYPILPEHQDGAMWFYSLPKHDNLCLPAEKIYADYLGAVKFGNLFSLDVGPDYNGKLRAIDVETLLKVGAMISSNGPAQANP